MAFIGGIIAFLSRANRRECLASIEYLGKGISKFRCADVPRYIEMIEHVCRKMGWDVGKFHGYRCAIDYPVYGSQIRMMFDPPGE